MITVLFSWVWYWIRDYNFEIVVTFDHDHDYYLTQYVCLFNFYLHEYCHCIQVLHTIAPSVSQNDVIHIQYVYYVKFPFPIFVEFCESGSHTRRSRSLTKSNFSCARHWDFTCRSFSATVTQTQQQPQMMCRQLTVPAAWKATLVEVVC